MLFKIVQKYHLTIVILVGENSHNYCKLDENLRNFHEFSQIPVCDLRNWDRKVLRVTISFQHYCIALVILLRFAEDVSSLLLFILFQKSSNYVNENFFLANFLHSEVSAHLKSIALNKDQNFVNIRSYLNHVNLQFFLQCFALMLKIESSC